MIYVSAKGPLALAIYLSSRGFGYAVFEGPTSLIDWGVTGVKAVRHDKNTQCLLKIEHLIELYQPDVLVIEANAALESRRSRRIRKLSQKIVERASKLKIRAESFSRPMVREFFSEFEAGTKQEIANTIARWFPELAPRLPPARKFWMSEDARMSLFDAVALGLTFFSVESKRKRA